MENDCPYCGAKTESARSSVVYGGRDYGKIILCTNWPDCDAYVGCHSDSGLPKGTLANGKLRTARIKVHSIFDPIWRSEGKKGHRSKVYKWLAKGLEIKPEDCHIGMFDLDLCGRAIEFLNNRGVDKAGTK